MEVAEWLEANQSKSISYVCLDDDDDFNRLPLVQTDPDFGLQEADLEACRKILDESVVEGAQAQNEYSTQEQRASGEERLFVRPDMLAGARVRHWSSGK